MSQVSTTEILAFPLSLANQDAKILIFFSKPLQSQEEDLYSTT
ncbi:hypothetical protein AM1_6356 [Acaryochloris marina MBIC11017]|uniref:Uncharacterized protein n=1 Tax=Acaryochloris marina (strain MBIC 11017) TaxID=329726 RepID=B0C8M4_ACAM1|nr:hypothetical protein AM1_6356 [Acaryochloris marina MBIC11017]